MKDVTHATELYKKHLFDVEDKIIKGLHEEERDEWRSYFKNAIPQNLNNNSLEEAFEKVQWKFNSYLLSEIISLFYPCPASNLQRKETISALEKVKGLYDNAIENNQWDRSLEWPIESFVDEVIRETIEDGVIPIVKPDQTQEYNSLMVSLYLLRDKDIAKALSEAVTISIIKASNQATLTSRSRESIFSRIFDTTGVSERERISRIKEVKEVQPSEYKKYARKLLSILKEI